MARKSPFKAAQIDLDAAETQIELLTERQFAMPRLRSLDIPTASIRPNPFQARKAFAGIEDLAQAMRMHGFVSRLLVRQDPSDQRCYQLVYGERRLRAAQLAGLSVIPCDVGEYDDSAMIEIGLAENIQRQDLNPVEEGHMFQTLVVEHGYTQQRLAERIGKDRSYVEVRLALLRAPDEVRQLVIERPGSLRAARDIAKLPTAEQRQALIDQVTQRGLSAPTVRALVNHELAAQTNAPNVPGHQGASANNPTLGPMVERESLETVGVIPETAAARRIQRTLAQDRSALQILCARWRQLLPKLGPEQRAELVTLIDHAQHDLSKLREIAGDGSTSQ